MLRRFFPLALVLLAACADSGAGSPLRDSRYLDLGPAPELAGETWLNAPAPLRLADLRGKVVLVEMWTFG